MGLRQGRNQTTSSLMAGHGRPWPAMAGHQTTSSLISPLTEAHQTTLSFRLQCGPKGHSGHGVLERHDRSSDAVLGREHCTTAQGMKRTHQKNSPKYEKTNPCWARGGPAGARKCTKNIGNPYQMEDNKAAPSAPPQGGGALRRPLGFCCLPFGKDFLCFWCISGPRWPFGPSSFFFFSFQPV